MNQGNSTYRYMVELRPIYEIVKNYSNGSGEKGCLYSIYYVVPNDKNWKQIEWDSKEYEQFLVRVEHIIETCEPDAIKIVLHMKKNEQYVIRIIPGIHIPVIDGDTEKALNRREQRQTKIQEKNMPNQGLNGALNPDPMMESGLGALQMQNLQKDFDIKLLQRDIDQFTKENQKLELENKELTEALYEYENKADKGKLENLGLLVGAGKLLKMDNQSLLGLAGMLMGDGGANMSLPAESTAPEQKGGGLDLSGSSPEREESINTIIQFLGSVDEETFRKVISLLQLIEKQSDLVDNLLKYALQQNTESLNTGKPE